MNDLSWVPILTIPLVIIYHLNMRNKIRNLENIIEKQKKKLSHRRSQSVGFDKSNQQNQHCLFPVLKVSLVLDTKSKDKLHEHNIIGSVHTETHINSVCTEIKDKNYIEISMYNEILGIKNV
jgi:hypothetical protein